MTHEPVSPNQFYIRQTRNVAIALVAFFFGAFATCTYQEERKADRQLQVDLAKINSPGYRLVEVK